MKTDHTLLDLFEEGFSRKTWHGPNLWQALKGVTAKQAAWRPGSNRHNIWELAMHVAYWKYAARRRLQGGKRGSFALKGSNFFPRPEAGKVSEAAWKADKELLRNEHEALREAIKNALKRPLTPKVRRMLWGVAFHDIYHAGQIRLLRRLEADKLSHK
jgi:uncharacterized damage-inducible protein DinB